MPVAVVARTAVALRQVPGAGAAGGASRLLRIERSNLTSPSCYRFVECRAAILSIAFQVGNYHFS